ncbi:hypothetical protein [Nocardioides aurantiacus]|uniref:Uncharacterized protein n=1 Tax=Nocardioides aurantiacus TaxID=86796 RepID=A0A3N2CSM9_9ACTN|nr:hypothetical protein [Nocardioides aurantiacus]ROR90552.1 hypothetical protein EDD33_1393 [Nocardioides aurantiacus]
MSSQFPPNPHQPGYPPRGNYPQGGHYPPPPPQKKSHTLRNVLLAILAGFVLLLGGCAVLFSVASTEFSTDSDGTTSGGGGDAEETADDTASYSCKDLAKEAAELSEKADVSLLKVRQLKMVRDLRTTYDVPTGDDEAPVLVCRGSGVWSDTTKSPVRLRLLVDSDEEFFVEYQEL